MSLYFASNLIRQQICSKFHNIQIPDNLQEPPRYDYFIKIKGTGGLEFENTTQGITYQEKSSTILVQTDKAIYKPGQTGTCCWLLFQVQRLS